MKNREFWKGALAGVLITACVSTGVYTGVNYFRGDTVLGDRKCTEKLTYLESMIDQYYLGDKDEEKLKEGLYTGLLYGLDDPSVKYTTMEDAFMENYRQLTPGHQYAVRAMAQNLLQVQQTEGRLKIHKLTRFEHQLAAGIGDPNEFEDSGTPIYVYDDSLTCRADCVFTVNGDSMEPDYPDGCRVLVERISDSGELAPGDIGAFMIDNETYIKEYQPDGLHSRNPAYPVMSFSEFEHVYLIGRVIGVLSKSDVAQPSDVEKYIELHPEFE